MCSFAAPPSPFPPPDHLYVCHTTHPSFITSVCCATSPCIISPAPPVCLSTRTSVTLSIRTCHPHPSILQTVQSPSHQSCEPSIRPSVTVRPSVHHPTTSVRLSYIVCPYIHHPHQFVQPSINARLSV